MYMYTKVYNIIIHNNKEEETTQMVSADEQINKIWYTPPSPQELLLSQRGSLGRKSISLGGEWKDSKADGTAAVVTWT